MHDYRLHTQKRSPVFSFDAYLRTGRLVPVATAANVEVKYNPWHDPDDGRFTFKGTGRYFGREQSGRLKSGSHRGFGGAGGSGTWERPHPKPRAHGRAADDTPRSNRHEKPSKRIPWVNPTFPVPPKLPQDEPWRHVVRNGYEYHIDTAQRTRRVTGTLTLTPAPQRSRTAQARAGGADRRPTDDGGHYIAHRFNGPTDAFNHFAQNANFNRGGYRALELRWAKATARGDRVYVKITPSYEGPSHRPVAINVWFAVAGKFESRKFSNQAKEKERAKR